MRFYILPFFIAFVLALAACNEETSAPVETEYKHVVKTIYTEVTDTLRDTIVIIRTDTLVIDVDHEVLEHDTLLNDPECTANEVDGTVFVSCGNKEFLINKGNCGSASFDPAKNFCYNGTVMDFCDGYAYNPEKFFCNSDTLVAQCGGKTYNPSKQYCQNGMIPMDTGFFLDERDNQKYKYVVIGSQTWMAQNLNYAYLQPTSTLDSSSFCFNNEPDSCAKYGRLYLWSAAIDSAGIFSDINYGNGYTVNCQLRSSTPLGICPDGWHLPSVAEWKILITTVGGLSVSGINLKTSEGWNFYADSTLGIDSYNFSVMPAGLFEFARNDFIPYIKLDEEGGFWTSICSDDIKASYVFFRNDYDHANISVYYKGSGRSIRCIKD